MGSSSSKLTKSSWSAQQQSSSQPSGRFDHVLVHVSDSKSWLYGGCSSGWAYNNDLWELNENTFAWTQLNPSGVQVPQLKDHTAVIYSGSMYVYGGNTSNKALNGDIFVFDGTQWSTLTVEGDKPQSRHAHSSFVYGTKMYVYAGSAYNDQQQDAFLDDFWSFDLVARKWELIKPTGEIPSKRNYQCTTVCGDEVILTGGFNGTPLGDVWHYNFGSNKWKKGSPFSPPRSGHEAILMDNHQLLMFSGEGRGANGTDVTCLNDTQVYIIKASKWISVNKDGDASAPGQRLGGKAIKLSQSGKPVVYLWGGVKVDAGWNPLTWYGDLWTFNKGPKSSAAPSSGKQEVVVSEQPKAQPQAHQQQQGQLLQAGGHAGAFAKGDEGQILKKVSKNELNFYTNMIGNDEDLKKFCPGFFGVKEEHVIMQDLTAGMTKPCIMDVKIGISSVGEDASEEKKAQMGAKDAKTTTVKLGMRLTALKVYDHSTSQYKSYGKDWGKQVTVETMKDSLALYFNDGKTVHKHLIPIFIEEIKKISAWFDSQHKFRFYSSSLLFLYDAEDTTKWGLKMIDFAHVHDIKDDGLDEGYRTGVKNLIAHLEQL